MKENEKEFGSVCLKNSFFMHKRDNLYNTDTNEIEGWRKRYKKTYKKYKKGIAF